MKVAYTNGQNPTYEVVDSHIGMVVFETNVANGNFSVLLLL